MEKTGLPRLDFNLLNQSIDRQLEEQSYQTRDRDFAIVPVDSEDTSFVLFDTGFTTPQGEIIYVVCA